MDCRKAGKRIKELRDRLNAEYGELYSIAHLDWEACLYRKLSERYSLEISGVNMINNKRFKCFADIRLWEMRDGREHIIKSIQDVPEERIHAVCEQLNKYRKEEIE